MKCISNCQSGGSLKKYKTIINNGQAVLKIVVMPQFKSQFSSHFVNHNHFFDPNNGIKLFKMSGKVRKLVEYWENTY